MAIEAAFSAWQSNPLAALRSQPISLHEQIAELIRDRIVSSAYGPGSSIDEKAIAAELSVSRTPVREALKVLNHDGLVDIQPNRGSFVAKLSSKQAADILDLLAEVEGFAAQRACQNASDHQIRMLGVMLLEMEAVYEKRDQLSYFNLNHNIHEGIVIASGNTELHGVFHAQSSRVRRLRFLSNSNARSWAQSLQDHRDLQAALEHRDARRMRKLMREHVASIMPSVQALLDAAECSVPV